MSEEKVKKNATKNNKNIKDNGKASKNKKSLTLRLDDNAEISVIITYMKDSECFKIDVNKIRVSDKKLYSKEQNSCKYYMFYEHDGGHIPFKVVLIDVVGYYKDYKDNDKYDAKYNAKKMIFKLHDNSSDKIIDIFDHIEKKRN